MRFRTAVFALALSITPFSLVAQVDFRLGGRNVQVHGFASQGFAYSGSNNYLTMNTGAGSFAMTDGGLNIGASLTEKFRVGAQFYLRNIGQLGDWHPEVDWAYGDYRFTDWFGVRAGKVKTTLGLYNDTQDAESLHTWAVLPQSVYPLDLRGNTIAHVGADLYGEVRLHRFGKLAYTGYVGARTFDTHGGYYYFSADQGIPIESVTGRAGDVEVAAYVAKTKGAIGYVSAGAAVAGVKTLEVK